jgi:hypothetical protein
VICGLIVVAIPISSWILSSILLDPHENLAARNLRVLSVGDGEVTLARTQASMRPGTYGLEWPGGSAIITTIVSVRPDSVTRKLSAVNGRLEPGTDTGVNDAVRNGNPRTALDIPTRK